EAEFIGTLRVAGVPNRRTVEVVMRTPWTSGMDVAGTGAMQLNDGASALASPNQTYIVASTPSLLTFTVAAQVSKPAGTGVPRGTFLVHGTPRISAAASEERAAAAYTSQLDPDDLWAFVILGDATPSRGLETVADGLDNQIPDESFRQQLVQSFSLLVFFPSSSSISGAPQRDRAEDLLPALTSALLGARFSSGLTVPLKGAVQFSGHGVSAYDPGGALYVHQYTFQQTVDIQYEDTVGPALDVAFRDIDLTTFPVLTVGDEPGPAVTVETMDLDDEPL
ncbi:MAG TPA: hypothetical protein VMX57_08450, partial [Planctomycetota bacterium]|nr:hypothetical protein [Planctomycetota bacterium]